MNSFFKLVLASTLGVLLAGSLLLFGSFIGVMTWGFLGVSSFTPQKNTLLHLNLKGTIQERSYPNPLNLLNPTPSTHTLGADIICKAIDQAIANTHIIGIFLETDGMTCGYATATRIRKKLQTFRQAGKFIVSYADAYSQEGYYLASVADSIAVNPVGSIDLHGISSQNIYFKDALEKLGIAIEVFRVGSYKSAVEPFTRNSMSEEARKQTQRYITSIWENVHSDIGKSRGINADTLNALANNLILLNQAQSYLQEELADTLLYREEMLEWLVQKTNAPSLGKLPLATIEEVSSIESDIQVLSKTIAVVYAVGEIDNMLSTSEGIDSRKLCRQLYELKSDSSVAGVVIHINSPGGSAFGSEQLWKAVSELKTVKPVAVSMGNVAASGGYYMACCADRIFAEPTTLTGSIGIFGMIPNAQKLFNHTLGIAFDGVSTNTSGNFPTITRPLTTLEKRQMQTNIENGYALFLQRCSQGRDIPLSGLDSLAQGRVWTGSDALNIGLVDALGSLEDAIDWTAAQCKLLNYHLESYPHLPDFWEVWLESLGFTAAQILQEKLPQPADNALQTLQQISTWDPLQTRFITPTIE